MHAISPSSTELEFVLDRDGDRFFQLDAVANVKAGNSVHVTISVVDKFANVIKVDGLSGPAKYDFTQTAVNLKFEGSSSGSTFNNFNNPTLITFLKPSNFNGPQSQTFTGLSPTIVEDMRASLEAVSSDISGDTGNGDSGNDDPAQVTTARAPTRSFSVLANTPSRFKFVSSPSTFETVGNVEEYHVVVQDESGNRITDYSEDVQLNVVGTGGVSYPTNGRINIFEGEGRIKVTTNAVQNSTQTPVKGSTQNPKRKCWKGPAKKEMLKRISQEGNAEKGQPRREC